MAEDVAEATESLPKEAGLVGLEGPLDQLYLTKMLAESFESQEQERSEETSPSGDAMEEAEPVEESTEEAVRAFCNQLPRQKSRGIKLELIRGIPPFCRSPPYETIETNI
ncbi:MAG TPA: hypothetical protein QGG93_09150 [Verrucomicrobiota bacterium]|nr:hypothetical protein [Verrucomicrobiota bacterium]